jgi:hypothetical protein
MYEAPRTIVEGTAPEPEGAAVEFQDALRGDAEPRRELLGVEDPEPISETDGARVPGPEAERPFEIEFQRQGESEQAATTDTESPAAEDEEFTFEDDGPLVAEPPSFLREASAGPSLDEPDDELSTPQKPYESDVDEVDGERWPPPLPQRHEEPGHERHESVARDVAAEPELVASGEPVPEEEWVAPEIPVDEAVAVSASGASSNGLHEAGAEDAAPETIPGEDDLSPEMASFLRSRRRDKKDNPFRGFDSPPGRF